MTHSTDYIPSHAENYVNILKRQEYMAAHPDKRPCYIFDVKIPNMGIQREAYLADTQNEAINLCISQWNLVGINIHEDDIKLVEVK